MSSGRFAPFEQMFHVKHCGCFERTMAYYSPGCVCASAGSASRVRAWR